MSDGNDYIQHTAKWCVFAGQSILQMITDYT